MKKTGAGPDGGRRPLEQALREYARGIIGGMLFSLPLLYTMEVWWAGFIAHPLHLLFYLGAGFILLLGYNRYAGLHKDASWLEVVIEAVEEMGIGLLLSTFLLWMLGQIDLGQPWPEIVGKITVEAVTVAIGVSVGASQLGGSQEEQEGGMAGDTRARDTSSIPGQVVLAACGAVLLASNVAPTEEIVQIALEASPWQIVTLALLSLGVGGFVLLYGGLDHKGQARPVTTVVSRSFTQYAVSLVASAFILWFFGRFQGTSLAVSLAEVVVLGVPACLGASVGRLLLQ